MTTVLYVDAAIRIPTQGIERGVTENATDSYLL
jgi:hypothetical protein